MDLIEIYENYKGKVDILKAAGATFLCVTSSNTEKDIYDLQAHVRRDVRESIINDTTFEEDINETNKTTKFKTA